MSTKIKSSETKRKRETFSEGHGGDQVEEVSPGSIEIDSHEQQGDKKAKLDPARVAAGAAGDNEPTIKKRKVNETPTPAPDAHGLAAVMSVEDQCKFAGLVWDSDTSFRQKMKPRLKKFWKPINDPATVRRLNLVFGNRFKVPTFKMKEARQVFLRLVSCSVALRASILAAPEFSSLLTEWLDNKN